MTAYRRCRYLSDEALQRYQVNGWYLTPTASDADERAAELYESCCHHHWPFILIKQPRRFCEIEADTGPMRGMNPFADAPELMLDGIREIHRVASDALRESPAPHKSKYLSVTSSSVTITGLDAEPAKRVAQRIANVYMNPSLFMPPAERTA